MRFEEFRTHLETFRRAADEEATALRDSFIVLDRLRGLYEALNHEERGMAECIFGEWALSEDEKVRFDALAMIDDFKIKVARGALEELSRRLTLSTVPSAPYELQKVKRVLADL